MPTDRGSRACEGSPGFRARQWRYPSAPPEPACCIESTRLQAEADADAQRLSADAELAGIQAREQVAAAIQANPVLLRMQELETLRDLAKVTSARIYIGFDKHHDLHVPEP
ncbi:MAG: hypothetical protein WD294_01465 [Phycisphaeraceae bacterium]